MGSFLYGRGQMGAWMLRNLRVGERVRFTTVDKFVPIGSDEQEGSEIFLNGASRGAGAGRILQEIVRTMTWMGSAWIGCASAGSTPISATTRGLGSRMRSAGRWNAGRTTFSRSTRSGAAHRARAALRPVDRRGMPREITSFVEGSRPRCAIKPEIDSRAPTLGLAYAEYWREGRQLGQQRLLPAATTG